MAAVHFITNLANLTGHMVSFVIFVSLLTTLRLVHLKIFELLVRFNEFCYGFRALKIWVNVTAAII